jgi:hypothetical protein
MGQRSFLLVVSWTIHICIVTVNLSRFLTLCVCFCSICVMQIDAHLRPEAGDIEARASRAAGWLSGLRDLSAQRSALSTGAYIQ